MWLSLDRKISASLVLCLCPSTRIRAFSAKTPKARSFEVVEIRPICVEVAHKLRGTIGELWGLPGRSLASVGPIGPGIARGFGQSRAGLDRVPANFGGGVPPLLGSAPVVHLLVELTPLRPKPGIGMPTPATVGPDSPSDHHPLSLPHPHLVQCLVLPRGSLPFWFALMVVVIVFHLVLLFFILLRLLVVLCFVLLLSVLSSCLPELS